MTHSEPHHQSQPDQGRYGWLVNTTQQRVVHFKPEPGSATTAWVAIRIYHYAPPRPPEPLSHRRVLHHEASKAWSDMLKSGWRPCRAPAR